MPASPNIGYEGVPPEQMERLSNFRSEHPTKPINVSGTAWRYISCGRGPEVLLLLPSGLRVAEAAFVLTQMFEEDYRVIAPTYAPLDTMNEMVDGIVAILDAEEVSEFHVLGQSYGGFVAQVLIQRYPSRIKKVVLSGTSPLVVVGWKRIQSAVFTSIAKMLPEPIVMRIFKRIMSPLVTVQESDRAFWDRYLYELFKHHMTKADLMSHLHTTRDAQINYAFIGEDKKSWRGEVLVVWGEKDHLRTERARQGMLDAFPQAQIVVIEGGGHTVGLSVPDKYAAAVKGFLETGVDNI
jgi:pimeloyl-ACP methyl ester carboxylesterase